MAISRFASLLDGIYEGWIEDGDYRAIVERDLLDGQHRNPEPVKNSAYFTTAYFHTTAELFKELESAGFIGLNLYAVEGPGWPLARQWMDSAARREHILDAVRSVEKELSLMGFSHHFIAVGANP